MMCPSSHSRWPLFTLAYKLTNLIYYLWRYTALLLARHELFNLSRKIVIEQLLLSLKSSWTTSQYGNIGSFTAESFQVRSDTRPYSPDVPRIRTEYIEVTYTTENMFSIFYYYLLKFKTNSVSRHASIKNQNYSIVPILFRIKPLTCSMAAWSTSISIKPLSLTSTTTGDEGNYPPDERR